MPGNPATLANFQALVPNPSPGSGVSLTGGTGTPQWLQLVTAVQGLAALLQGKYSTGTEPNDQLNYIAFGDAVGNYFKLRLGFDGTNFIIQNNTGTQGTPIWSTIFTINASTGAATLTAGLAIVGTLTGVSGLTLTGDLNAGTHNFTNVGTISVTTVTLSGQINGFTIGGSINPQDIGTAAAAGTGTNFARVDHVHKGMRSLGALFGDVLLGPGLGTFGNTVILTGATMPTITTPGGADQSITTNGADIDLTGLTALAFPGGGANGTNSFIVRYCVKLTSANVQAVTAKVFVGATGTHTDTVQDITPGSVSVANGNGECSGEIFVNPANANKIGLTLNVASQPVTVYGGATAKRNSYISITQSF